MSSSPTEHAGGRSTMPQDGRSPSSEGTILEWRKQPGDWVEADETIADVTTDKVDVEIPSPATGRLARIVVEAGRDGRRRRRRSPRSTPARSRARRIPTRSRSRRTPRPRRPALEPRTARWTAPASSRRWCGGSPTSTGSTSSQVEGTGIGGRVRKKDVLAHVETAATARPKRAPAPHASRPTGPTSRRRRPTEPAVRTASRATGDRREPMSPMRQAIARHMVDEPAARRRTARRSSRSTCRRVAARRASCKEAMARRGVTLTYLAFVARATVEALARVPGPQRLDRGRRDRPPRRRQPRDRGGARRRA